MKNNLQKQSRTSGTKPAEQKKKHSRVREKRPSPLLAASMFGFVPHVVSDSFSLAGFIVLQQQQRQRVFPVTLLTRCS